MLSVFTCDWCETTNQVSGGSDTLATLKITTHMAETKNKKRYRKISTQLEIEHQEHMNIRINAKSPEAPFKYDYRPGGWLRSASERPHVGVESWVSTT